MNHRTTTQGLDITVHVDDTARNRIEVTGRAVIRAPCEQIFELCCPVREEEWIDGWDSNVYELLHSRSGINEKNCVFRERLSKPMFFGEPGPTTWVTTVHDPDRFALEFLLLFGDIGVLNRSSQLERLDDDATACDCTDTLLLLDRTLSSSQLDLLATKMQAFLYVTWNALRHYCETGEALPSQLAVASPAADPRKGEAHDTQRKR